MSLIWLVLGFALFMALIWSVYAINRATALRVGYEPFSLPNAALMLVANLLLLSALAPDSGPEVAPEFAPEFALAAVEALWVKLGAALLIAVLSLVIIARRTGLGTALYAVTLLSVLAIAVLPSLVFMRLAGDAAESNAGSGSDGGSPGRGKDSQTRADR